MSDSHIPLRDGWTLWRWLLLRGAGFPATRVLEIAVTEAADAADRLAALEALARGERATVLDDLDKLRGGPAKAVRALVHRLRRGESLPSEGEVDAPGFARLRTLEADVALARAELDAALAAGAVRTREALLRTACDPRFREALLWQNPHALHTGVDRLLASPNATNKDGRQREAMIASYLQRYCLKNDTIGFFGPTGWAQLSSADEVVIAPGPSLLRNRTVHFEHWAIDVLAAYISSWPDARPFIAPRLLPSARVEGVILHYGVDRTTKLPEAAARLLAACDGDTLAIDIARRLCSDRSLDLSSIDEVYELLDELAEAKLVVWTLEPSAVSDPDVTLRRLVEQFGDEPRARAVALLDRLEAARTAVALASGNPERLDQSLAALNASFAELSGVAATRLGGKTYAGRTVIYEDCVRDVRAAFGKPLLDRISPLLSLISQSARWFTHELASRVRSVVHERYRDLTSGTATPVGYVRFLGAISDLLSDAAQLRGTSVIADAVVAELERRWATVLRIDSSQRLVELSASEMRAAVADCFRAPAPGWAGARHVAPDVMLAARSAAAVARGEFIAVLGEVHIGNTLFPRALRPHGPQTDDCLIQWYSDDRASQGIVPVPPRDQVTRAQTLPWTLVDFDLELGAARSWKPREHVLRAADILVEEIGGVLQARDLRTGIVFDIIALLESYMMIMSSGFKPVPRGDHVPRVTIDGTVLCREQWRFIGDALPKLDGRGGPAQFTAARQWAAQHGMPRFVFIKVPEEPKPTYLDFASPLLVSMFAKTLRAASSLTVSEMLPSIEECWLPDAEGSVYTSELRLIAVDPIPWQPTLHPR